jgi:hypothetical protein
MTTTQETKYEVWVGGNLFDDWDTRGIIHELESETDGRFSVVRQNKVRVKISATKLVLDYLVDDADYQVSKDRDAEASTIRTNRTFITRAQEAMKEGN